MKYKGNIALHLQCIEDDLRRYLMDPSDFTSEYFEDVHCLLLDVMDRMGIEPVSTEGDEE
jgi:hypothetical protein